MLEKYALRKAAGANWLIDVEQKDGQYKEPDYINDTAALIISCLKGGMSKEDTAKSIADSYGVDSGIVLKDIDELLNSLCK